MSKPRLTIVTINYNDLMGLKATIESVTQQNYSQFEYLIVDGDSNDGSVDLIKGYDQDLFKALIEKDKGIYHAMNKAISIAKGEWLIFMNSGDVFVDCASLELAMNNIIEGDAVLYADWIYAKSGKYVKSSKKKMTLRHQSVIYKKSLHDIYGTYIVAPDVTISDYIFFSSISKVSWRHHNRPLSICDETGVSAKVAHFYQKTSVDFIFGNSGKAWVIFIFLFFQIYRFLKRIHKVN